MFKNQIKCWKKKCSAYSDAFVHRNQRGRRADDMIRQFSKLIEKKRKKIFDFSRKSIRLTRVRLTRRHDPPVIENIANFVKIRLV